MATYSAPIQPPTQTNYKQRFDIARGDWSRQGFNGWFLSTASSPFTTAPTPVRNTVIDFSSTTTYGPQLQAVNDTYYPVSGSTSSTYAFIQKTMFLRPLAPDGLLGPLTDNTPTPQGATGWRYDPTDTPGGQWLGDYTVSISWRIIAGVQTRAGQGSVGPFMPSPPLPSVTANLRLLPASYFTESSGSNWLLNTYRWPGAFDAASGTLLHSRTLPAGSNPNAPSIGGDFPAETFTIPAGTDTLGLYTTCNQVEGADAAVNPPASLYAHPPYYEDYYIANALLAITRDLRPQRYQWIYPDAEVNYPISETRRTSNSAFLGRRR